MILALQPTLRNVHTTRWKPSSYLGYFGYRNGTLILSAFGSCPPILHPFFFGVTFWEEERTRFATPFRCSPRTAKDVHKRKWKSWPSGSRHGKNRRLRLAKAPALGGLVLVLCVRSSCDIRARAQEYVLLNLALIHGMRPGSKAFRLILRNEKGQPYLLQTFSSHSWWNSLCFIYGKAAGRA